MLVHALRELGADPAFFIGGELPGAGEDGGAANAGWGEGEWVVAEADESDGSFLELRPEVAVVTNVELDHHSRWSSLAELRQAFARFAEPAAAAIGEGDFDESRPGPALDLAVPGAHNVLNARAALAALAAAGFDLDACRGGARELPGHRPPPGAQGHDRRPGRSSTTTTPITRPRSRRRSPRCASSSPRRLIAVFQPHLYSRTQALAGRFGAVARRRRRGRRPRRLRRPRAAGRRARRGQRARRRPRRRRPRRRQAGLVAARPRQRRASPAPAAARGRPPGHDRSGRRLQARRGPPGPTPHARRRSRGRGGSYSRGRGGVIPEHAMVEIQAEFPLARLTTVRTGGSADHFARPSTEAELVELLAWAAERELAVEVVGSGSNLLVADSGVRGLVLKLDGELTRLERHGTAARLRRRHAAAVGRREGGGLGPRRARVRDQHPGHGRRGGADERERLRRRARRGARVGRRLRRLRDRAPPSRQPRLRVPAIGARRRGRSSRRRPSRSPRPTPPPSRRRSPRCARSAARRSPRGSRRSARRSRTPTTSAPAAAPRASCSTAVGARGLAVGGARFSPKHANFVENSGTATTAEILELLAAGRRLVFERYGIVLEPEVQVLGDAAWPAGWELGRAEPGAVEEPDDPRPRIGRSGGVIPAAGARPRPRGRRGSPTCSGSATPRSSASTTSRSSG